MGLDAQLEVLGAMAPSEKAAAFALLPSDAKRRLFIRLAPLDQGRVLAGCASADRSALFADLGAPERKAMLAAMPAKVPTP